ncbi:MAG: hypothetical protein MJ221_03690 [Bacilli bacterium]|nr:hypothetical protein [Bacilli bacterium]
MRKSVKVMMILSIIFGAIGAAVFATGPFVAQAMNIPGFYFLDKVFESMIISFPRMFSFENIRAIIPFITFVAFVVLWLLWLILTIVRKRKHSIAPMIVGFFIYSIIFVVVYALVFDVSDIATISPAVSHTGVSLLEYYLDASTKDPNVILMLAMVFVALGFIALTFVFQFIGTLIDLCTTRKYFERKLQGQSVDDQAKAEAVQSSKEVLKLLEEPIVEETLPVEEPKEEPKPIEEPKEESKPEPAPQPAPQPAPVAAQTVTPQPFIFQQFFNGTTPVQNIGGVEKKEEPKPVEEPKPEPAPVPSLSEEEIRSLIHEEVKNASMNAHIVDILHGELPTGHGNEIRQIVREEIQKVANDEVMARIFAYIRQIVAEELNKVAFQQVSEVKEEPKPVEEPKPEPKPVEEPKPEPVPMVAPVVAPAVEEKPKIIRIPFTERCKVMSPEMRRNFNELKSDIMAYGVHSRVSNSGDTFRLHTKTYVKITIAGNSLKLYFALDPKEYADSTLPIADAGHKGIYKEIPLVFKVKSDLSLRRAKQLISDAMSADGLKQTDIEKKDWIQEIIDSNPSK